MNQYDAIVIGAGHNGLTNGAYLAKAGLKVAVLERNPYIGGATVSRELHKGWWYSNCSYVSRIMSVNKASSFWAARRSTVETIF